jgi:xanthine dehydrogenase accessory factor
MREVLDDLVAAMVAGHTVGLGTVVRTFRSAPRPAGAAMMVDADGSAVGSVSGGCVEGALYELATKVVQSGRPVLQRYGISDDAAFEVGLTCGGILDIFVEPVSTKIFPDLPQVADDVRGLLAAGRNATRPGG